MEFAEVQLKKYGWRKGRGLGRNEDGPANAVRVPLKRDTAGVGYHLSEDFTCQWWSQVFNKTADSFSVETEKEGVTIRSRECDAARKLKAKHFDQHRSSLLYGRFQKSTATYKDGCTSVSKQKREHSAINDDKEDGHGPILNDADLFKACEGRTAHKAAKLGVQMSGKLQRVAVQDEDFVTPKQKKKCNSLKTSQNKLRTKRRKSHAI